MVAVLNELAEPGYIERAADPDDRRRNVVLLTPPGRRRLDELGELVDAIQDELLAPLTPDEREQLIALLERLSDHHSRHSH
jgi:DNA-binding MarR family transcriptional regulator